MKRNGRGGPTRNAATGRHSRPYGSLEADRIVVRTLETLASPLQTLDTATLGGLPAPVSGWRRVFRDWGVVSGSAVVCHLVGVATSLLLKMLLDPAQMGIWQAIKLFLSWGNYANLGISKGAVREYTVASGHAHGHGGRARRGLDLAFAVNTISSLAYAGLLLVAAVWIGLSGRGPWTAAWAVGLAVVGCLAVLSRYVSYQVTLLRARQRFSTTARLSLLEAVLTLGVCGVATWWWGIYGLYLGTLVVLVASFLFVQRRQVAALRWAWDTAEIRRLIGIGGPILLAGTTASLFRSLDKLMILGYTSDREFQLGCYSVAIMVSAQVFGLGNMLAMVMGPRYGQAYGRTGSRREVARLAARASQLQAAAMALVGGVSLALAPAVLVRLLPDYAPGLGALVWLVPGAAALVMALPASQYLVAVDRQKRALGAVLGATVLGAVGNYIALTAGWGLTGVAAATATAYAVYWLLAVGVSFWRELSGGERLGYAGLCGLTLIPTLGMAVWLEMARPGGESDLATTAAKLAVVGLTWCVTAAAAWHLGHWWEAIKE